MQSIFSKQGQLVPEDLARQEEEIRKRTNEALASAIVGTFICGIVLGPYALMRANQAVSLMGEHGVGYQYEGRANAARVIGVIEILLFVLVLFLRLKNVR